MGRRDTRRRSPPGDPRRRNDNRYGGGRRSRSPRRPQDSRDDRRRPNRRDDYSYRPGDRDGDRRRRSVDRDYRERRDDSRERTSRRRDDSTDSKRKARRDDSRERTQAPLPSAPQKPTAIPDSAPQVDEAQAKRLAKLDEWKAKQAADRDRKQKELDAAGGTRGLLLEMDRKAAGLPPTAPSVQSPDAIPPSTSNLKVIKFDPKAIARKAALGSTTSVPKALGTDVAPFVQAKTSTFVPSATDKSNEKKTVTAPVSSKIAMKSSASSTKVGNVSGFGLGSKQSAPATGQKRTFDFGEEESTRKKFIPLSEDTALDRSPVVHDEDVDDNDFDEANSDNEEGNAAAVLAATRIRDERMKAEAAQDDVDVQMGEATEPTTTTNGEEEEIDPLDAFMANLNSTDSTRKPNAGKTAGKKVQAVALFDDDNDYDYDQVADPDDLIAPVQKKVKKDLPKVDHSKIDYPPFRKAFYIEPSEMAEMTDDQVAVMRAELENIKVRGLNVPRPVRSFAQCGLGVQTLDVIQNLKYKSPTSIQAQAIPAVMAGRDVIGVAKTGSGKTISFLLPMFRHIMDQPPLEPGDGPIALILTPTRELAVQTRDACKPFAKALKLRAACVYGGAPIKDQIADLKRGAEIMVCTPGRVIEVLTANSGRVTNLRRVTYVVLDEADRMFDMGFEPQVVKILGNVRPDRQIVLFSATFPSKMESLARKTLTKPVEIVVGGRSVVAPEITQKIQIMQKADKFNGLLKVLGDFYNSDESENDRTLIFVDRQEAADTLLHDLLTKGYASFSIHGGKDQIDRDSAIDDFKRGVVPILIATSVAARGLDVKQLKLVINYDAPNHLEDYVHRAGRTGRAGNTGTCITFVTPEQERFAVDIVKALKQSGQDVPQELQGMADSFLEKVKEGKEKASFGFGGKGLEKLDQDRSAAKARERKAYGDDEGNEVEEQEEEVVTKTKDEGIILPADTPTVVHSTNNTLTSLAEEKIVVHRSTSATTANTANKSTTDSPLDRVNAAAARVGNRLGKKNEIHHGQPIDNKGPDAGLFHATLEINDYPQKARWAVTNRTNVAKILETFGVSITTKGEFYPVGKDAVPDKPKLYILVEGDTENLVTAAMRELLRLLREGVSAAETSEARMPNTGRYSVV